MSDWVSELREAYLNDRVSTVLAAHLRSETPPGTCRYCTRAWRPHATSRLDGHARCIVSEAFQRTIEFTWRTNPKVTVAALSGALGVAKSVVEVWIRRVGQMRTDQGQRAA